MRCRRIKQGPFLRCICNISHQPFAWPCLCLCCVDFCPIRELHFFYLPRRFQIPERRPGSAVMRQKLVSSWPHNVAKKSFSRKSFLENRTLMFLPRTIKLKFTFTAVWMAAGSLKCCRVSDHCSKNNKIGATDVMIAELHKDKQSHNFLFFILAKFSLIKADR